MAARRAHLEWNASSLTLTKVAKDRVLPAYQLTPRAWPDDQTAHQWGLEQRNGQPVWFMGGHAKTEGEIREFQQAARLAKPTHAVLMTPSEVMSDEALEPWEHHFWLDSLEVGDVLGGAWSLYVHGGAASAAVQTLPPLRGVTPWQAGRVRRESP